MLIVLYDGAMVLVRMTCYTDSSVTTVRDDIAISIV